MVSIINTIKCCCTALLLCCAACATHSEEDKLPAPNPSAPQHLNASFESIASRTEVVENRLIHWSADDEIAYLPCTNTNLQYRLQSSEGASGTFALVSEPTLSGEALSRRYAIYPYAADITITDSGDLAVTLPAVQHYSKDSFGEGAATMVATQGEDSSLRFKSAVGYLKLQLYGKAVTVRRIELRGNTGEKLAGRATIIAGTVPHVTMEGAATEIVTLDCGAGVRISEDKSTPTAFWLALPEVLFAEGFNITIYDTSNTPYVKTTANAYSIDRNMIQPMKALDVRGDMNIDIEEVDGKVRFYLTERSGGLREVAGLAPRDWSGSRVLLNGTEYTVALDESNMPYIEAAYAEDSTYNAVLLTEQSAQWYGTSPYEGVTLPCSQFDNRSAAVICSFPMYATYSKAEGRTLHFDDGFALLHLRVQGSGNIISARVEAKSRYDLAGRVATVPATGLYSIESGTSFVALNCTNGGDFASLNGSSYRDFYLMIAPGDYSDGLRLSLCDSDHKAVHYTISGLKLSAGKCHTFELSYAPDKNLIFYEGFDNCVWGGDIVRGSEGTGFAPDDSEVGYNTNLDRTGYEEALTEVTYDCAGSPFVQSNTWAEVSDYWVATSHQISDSYITSRHFADTHYLFRTQEHPGYIAVGTATKSRGIYRSPMLCNMNGIGSCRIKIRFAMQAGFNGTLQFQVIKGGRIVAAKLDGKAITLDSTNFLHSGLISTISFAASELSVATNAADEKVWHTLEVDVADAANGTYVHLTDEKTSTGIHGIYIDYIEAYKMGEWQRKSSTLRVILWNIQNGMWGDQHNNYDNFVKWVAKWDPDICIWCESETIYKDMTATSTSSKYLPDGWGELAARYGHPYTAVGGNRDNFPQTVTSKYPISVVQRITDTDVANMPVSHGAGHFTIIVNGKRINIVTLHMWPQSYGYGVATADREASTANEEGHKQRIHEMQYIANQTIKNPLYAAEQYWLFGGDTNSRSRLDNWHYKYAEDALILSTHDILLNQTTLKDVIGHRYPGHFMASTVGGNSRIDFMYASPAMYNMMDNSITLTDKWISESTKSEYHSSFYSRSDHLPILMDFDMAK